MPVIPAYFHGPPNLSVTVDALEPGVKVRIMLANGCLSVDHLGPNGERVASLTTAAARMIINAIQEAECQRKYAAQRKDPQP